MLPFIISLAVFLMVGVIASALILNIQAERRKKHLEKIQGKALPVKKASLDNPNQRRATLEQKLKQNEKAGSKKETIHDLIMQAGLSLSVQKFWIFSLIFAVLITFLVKAIGASPFVTIMAAIIALFGLPKLFLKAKAQGRQKKFLEDFAEALESMMRLLKAGMPVTEAIRMVANEFDGPIGEEMSQIYDQQKIGTPLPEAVLNAAKRMPLTEMQMFATAIAIQTQTGSSLSEVLQNLAAVIRARFKLKRKVKALSSEATASAGIIGALPVVVAGGMYFINREYIEVLFIDPSGKMLLIGAVVWMCVGIFVMKQMINFKV